MKTRFETYALLYKAHIDELYSYGLSLGNTEDACMDAIHDVFCTLIAKDIDTERMDNPKFYLFRSMKNRLIDMQKHNRKISYNDMGAHTFRADIDAADNMTISAEERNILISRVKKLMDRLTSTQREAIYLRFMQEMEYDQIAILLKITPESVRKLVHRGVKKMRQHSTDLMGFLIIMYLLKNATCF